MAAVAPAALALSVTLDAVATLGLVLLSADGPLLPALLPCTPDPRWNIAASLGDILLLTLGRGCLVMLPLLLGVSPSVPWLAAALVIVLAMSGWLLAKAALLAQLAAADHWRRFLVVPGTGVTLHVPTLLAAQLTGCFFGVFLLGLVWVNRAVMARPGDSSNAAMVALQARSAAAAQQRLAVQQWLRASGEPEGSGSDLAAPLLLAPAGAPPPAAPGDGDGGESFVSAHSRQPSASSWASAASQAHAAVRLD